MEIPEQVIADVASGVRSAVAVVDADERPERAGLDLAVVLQHLIRLHDGHREISADVASEISKPEQTIPPLPPAVGIPIKGLPATGHQFHQSS